MTVPIAEAGRGCEGALVRAVLPAVVAIVMATVMVPGCSEGEAPPGADDPATRSEAAPVPPVDADEVATLLATLPSPRPPGSEGHTAARRFLLERLGAMGYEPLVFPFDGPGAPTVELANLEVRLGTDDPLAPIVMVGAHYDTVWGTPGADDNGSGVVVLLTLARRLAGLSLDAEVRLIWFDGEERGLLGAVAYVAALTPDERQRCIGLINLESIGFVDRNPGSQRLPEGISVVFDPGDRGDFLLVAGNLSSLGLTNIVANGLAAEAGEDFRVESFGWIPGEGWAVPDIRRSDHAPFWDAGLPAVLLTDTAPFRNPNYHRSTDTVETLDMLFLSAVSRGVERAVIVLASP